MLQNFQKIRKKITEFYHLLIKNGLFFLVALSIIDIYFYLQFWDEGITNLFVGFRLFISVLIILYGIFGIFKSIWDYFYAKRMSKKKYVIDFGFDLESLCAVKIGTTEPKNPKFTPTQPVDFLIQDFLIHCKSSVVDIQILALCKIQKILFKPSAPIQKMIDFGILPILVELLESPNHQIKVYASVFLAKIAKTDSDFIVDIIETDAIPVFVKMLKNDAIRGHALYVLLLILDYDRDYCNTYMEYGIIEAFITCFNAPLILADLAGNLVAMTAHLCRLKPFSDDDNENESFPTATHNTLLPLLHKIPFAAANHGYAYSNFLGFCNDLIHAGPEHIQLLIDHKLLGLIIKNLAKTESANQIFAYNVLTKFLSSDPEKNIQHLIDLKILPISQGIFGNAEVQLKRALLKFLTAIFDGGNEAQIQAFNHANFLLLLIYLLRGPDNVELLKELLEAFLSFIKSSSSAQISILINWNFISSISKYFLHENQEYQKLALLCVKHLFKKVENREGKEICIQLFKCGGYADIQKIQMHPKLNKIANEIVKDYVNFRNAELAEIKVFDF